MTRGGDGGGRLLTSVRRENNGAGESDGQYKGAGPVRTTTADTDYFRPNAGRRLEAAALDRQRREEHRTHGRQHRRWWWLGEDDATATRPDATAAVLGSSRRPSPRVHGSWPSGLMDDLTSDCLVADDSVEGFKDGVPLNAWELEDVIYGYFKPWDELAMIFSKFDHTGFGEMSIDNFRATVYEPEFRSQIVDLTDPASLQRLEYRTVQPMPVTYQEFVDLIAYCIADECLPGESSDVKKVYSLHYRCWPPPLFIPAITALQVALFVFYALQSPKAVGYSSGTIPVDSALIYRSDMRRQTWRFFTYALVHAGYWHLFFNLTIQLLIGLPLEMVHGSFKICFIYMSGVLAGSLATSIFDPDVFLVGASGAVYAILAAHVANVLLNFTHIDCGLFWIIISLLIASFDVAFAIWDRYVRTSPQDHPVSYAAHLAGSLSGLTLGLMLLNTYERQRSSPSQQSAYVWPLAILACMMFIGIAVVWNIMH